MKTRICLVRHGETEWNAERRLQGHTDVPLNSTGRAQAEATADSLDDLSFDAIYSSDLARARETAQCCASRLGIAVRTHAGLRERHFGIFQGLTYAQASARHPDAFIAFQRRDPDYAFDEGGESLRALATRVDEVINDLADRHPGQQILVVAHGGVLDTINRMIRALPLDIPRDFVIPNAALNWIEREGQDWRIERWADQRHLELARDELPG